MNKLIDHIVNSTDTFKELLVIYLLILGVAAGIYSIAEQQSFGDSVWWAFVTATTVGYGDLAPVTTVGRVVAVVLMHLVPVFVIPLVIVQMLRTFVRDEHEFTHHEQEKIKADLEAIKKALKIEQRVE